MPTQPSPSAFHPHLALEFIPGLARLTEMEWQREVDDSPLRLLHPGLPLLAVTRDFTAEELPQILTAARRMRSIHGLLQVLKVFPVSRQRSSADLTAGLESLLSDLPYRRVLHGRSFRATVNRRDKSLPTTSMDLERRIGALVRRCVPEAVVRLKDYGCQIRTDLFHDIGFIAESLTPKPLSTRHLKVYNPSLAMKANLAFLMLELADAGSLSNLADPFCGSGSILIEAALTLPHLQLYGSDKEQRSIEGTRANIAANCPSQSVVLQQAALQDLPRSVNWPLLDAIVTDPPYGLRCDEGMAFGNFYLELLAASLSLLKPGGLLALLVMKHRTFDRALKMHQSSHRDQVSMFVMESKLPIITGGKEIFAYKLRCRSP